MKTPSTNQMRSDEQSVLLVIMLVMLLVRCGATWGQTSTRPAGQADWPRSVEHERVLAAAERSVAEAAGRVSSDRYRPGYHFLPAARFMNDPNGCVQVDGVYHMFFQHLPTWGDKDASGGPCWGHASSRDLVRWQRLPIALAPEPGTYDAQAIASGACVVADGQPTIIYTSVPPQAQSLARSFDGMRTWRKYAANPVIAKPPAIAGLEDGFRDPFVWREGANWRMLVGSGVRGKGGSVLLYESPDLIAWEFLGQLATGMGPDCFQWECPNFFPLGDRWALVVSPLFRSIPALRGPVQYTVGRYDGRRFEHGDWHLLDLGGPGVFYAPNCLRDEQGRLIMWGWLMGGGEPESPWNGMLTVPRELTLGPDQRLRTWPVKEIESLRVEQLAEVTDRKLELGQPWDVAVGTQLDVEITLHPWGEGRLSIQAFASADVASAATPAATITFDPATGELRCQDKVGILPRSSSDSCTLRLLIDRSVIEIYADHREVMSIRCHPPAGAETLRLTADRAAIPINRIQAWRMASIW